MQNILPSQSSFFNFEFLRVIGTAPFQGSDVGECLEAATLIKNNNPESWYKAWSLAAENAEALAKEALTIGDKEAARWAFLRASNYRRSSEFMLHASPSDSRLESSIAKSVEDFQAACELFSSPVIKLDIRYSDSPTPLPAYLYLPTSPPSPGKKTPILISSGGFDSTQEELYYFTSSGARTRGYAALSFEGPGQGIVVRRDGLRLRPDWEVVVSAVLDGLVSESAKHPEWNLDVDRIAIAGASMGGYFALRGATDPRIKACISIDGFYDLGDTLRARVPGFLVSAMEKRWLSDATLDAILNVAAKLDFQTGWEFGHAKLVLGHTSTVAAIREMLFNFTLREGEGSILSRVACPVLVTGAKDTLYFPLETGPLRIYNELSHLKDGDRKLWVPTKPSQGSLQAKVAALAALHANMFSWLNDVFDHRP